MTDTTPGPDHAAPGVPFFEYAKKAFSGGAAAAAAAVTPTLLASVFNDGMVSVEEVGAVVAAVAAGFTVGFLAVFFPKNRKR